MFDRIQKCINIRSAVRGSLSVVCFLEIAEVRAVFQRVWFYCGYGHCGYQTGGNWRFSYKVGGSWNAVTEDCGAVRAIRISSTF